MLISQIKRGVQTFCTLWVHMGEVVWTFELFLRHTDSNKPKIFSLIHHYWQFFHDPQHQFCQECILILQHFHPTRLWLATRLARTNKRKWSLKKWRNQVKLNAIAGYFYFIKFVKFSVCLYSRLPSSVSTIFCNKPHTETFLTLQSKWAEEEKLCLYNNSAFRGRN